jgi:hypothetical protein
MKGTRWIVLVVVLLLGNVLAVSGLIAASRGTPERVVPEYQRRGVRP